MRQSRTEPCRGDPLLLLGAASLIVGEAVILLGPRPTDLYSDLVRIQLELVEAMERLRRLDTRNP